MNKGGGDMNSQSNSLLIKELFNKLNQQIPASQIDGLEDVLQNALLQFRQKNKAYSIGDYAFVSPTNLGFYLYCTTAGTTGSANIDINSYNENDYVVDGSVTWQVKCAVKVPEEGLFELDSNGDIMPK